ncbi:cupin domain-containing protein [Microbacterium sp. HJ5]
MSEAREVRGVVQIDPHAALQAVPDDAGERADVHFVGANPGFTVGLWEAGPLSEAMAPYPSDEVCVVIEGEIRITEVDGTRHVFGRGDVFALRCGAELAWSNSEGARKIFIGLSAPSGIDR